MRCDLGVVTDWWLSSGWTVAPPAVSPRLLPEAVLPSPEPPRCWCGRCCSFIPPPPFCPLGEVTSSVSLGFVPREAGVEAWGSFPWWVCSFEATEVLHRCCLV